MPTKLGDIDDYFSPGLTVTVRGKEYTVPLASAELGLWCQRMAAATGELSEDSTEEQMRAAAERIAAIKQPAGEFTLPELILGTSGNEYATGDTYDQMVSDGVEYPFIEFVGITGYIWIVAGEDAAARWYRSGGRPESPGPTNRASKRAVARTGATNTGAASVTRSRANTSGTTSRQKSAKPKSSRKSSG